MRKTAFDINEAEGCKLAYSTVGFPLDKDVYPDGLRSDQKRSILRSIISRERKKSDLRVIKKYEGWDRFLRCIRRKIAEKAWEGALRFMKDLQRYHYLVCGAFGVREQNKKGDQRHIVYHCSQRRRCPVCNERYHKGRSYERGDIAAAVMLANDVKYLRKFELTFPDFLWNQIKGADDMKIFKSLANKMLQEFFGCLMKGVCTYSNGSVGIHIQIHWYSSKEPWKKKPHLHCYVIPIKLESGQAKNVDRFISEADLKRLKSAWSDCVKRACVKLGYRTIKRIPDELVVHHQFINLPKNIEEKGRYGFNFRYDQRSPVEDLNKAVMGIDFKQEQIIMAFNQNHYDYYAIWSFDDYADQLIERMKFNGRNTTYGWLRRFKQNAPALGVEVKKEEDPFTPVPELSVNVRYTREYQEAYSKEKKKVEMVKRMFFGRLIDPDKAEYREEIDPWKVHGEEMSTGSKKRYLYQVAKGKSPPDRGG